MKALEHLTENIASLTAAVDRGVAVISNQTGVPEADVDAAADAVQAQTDRLTNALDQTGTPPESSQPAARHK